VPAHRHDAALGERYAPVVLAGMSAFAMLSLWVHADALKLESLRSQPMVHSGGLPIVAVIECPYAFRDHPVLGETFAALMAEQTRGKLRTSVANCAVWR
jgi:hypothetical protein